MLCDTMNTSKDQNSNVGKISGRSPLEPRTKRLEDTEYVGGGKCLGR